VTRSRPTRARGLKPDYVDIVKRGQNVAPHAGAWIETGLLASTSKNGKVAPHAGAWIETSNVQLIRKQKLSRPTRARGLKPCGTGMLLGDSVAPHAGAWIETIEQTTGRPLDASRPTRARGLKHEIASRCNVITESRAPRGRVD